MPVVGRCQNESVPRQDTSPRAMSRGPPALVPIRSRGPQAFWRPPSPASRILGIPRPVETRGRRHRSHVRGMQIRVLLVVSCATRSTTPSFGAAGLAMDVQYGPRRVDRPTPAARSRPAMRSRPRRLRVALPAMARPRQRLSAAEACAPAGFGPAPTRGERGARRPRAPEHHEDTYDGARVTMALCSGRSGTSAPSHTMTRRSDAPAGTFAP